MRDYSPKQERGRQRVNRLLDAAAEVFGEVGYEAATTILIAERAATSVGSLYQFFPNKEAIAKALAERYVATWEAQTAAMPIERFTEMTVEQMTDAFIEPLREFIRDNRDFHVLFASSQTSRALAEAIHPADEALLQRTDAVFALMRPDLSAAERRRYGLIGRYIVKGLLAAVAYSDELDFDTVFDELKHVMNRYLEPIMRREETLPSDHSP